MTYIVKMDGNTRGGGHSEALKNYNLGKTLGAGTFGNVKIAEHKLTGQKVAIKILNRRQMETMEMEEKGMPPSPCTIVYDTFDLLAQDFKLSAFSAGQACACVPDSQLIH